jgi:iron(III) transport system substrate-binding protein
MITRLAFLLTFVFGFVLFSQIGRDSPAAEKPDRKAEWEKTLKAAKTEGQVTVYGWSRESHLQALTEFQKIYSEIKLILISGSGSDLGPRIIAERRAGKYLADLFIVGTTTPVEVLLPAKALDPIRPHLILPEVSDESLWFGKKFHFADAEKEYVLLNDGTVETSLIAYNTKLVRPEEIQSYWDLLQPKWRGKILAYDPRKRSGAGGPIRFLYFSPKLGPKFVYRLFNEMDLTLAGEGHLMTDWLATGKFPLFIFPAAGDIDKAKKQGLPVDEMTHLSQEGASMHAGAGAVGIMNRPAHPNATKVYLNWYLSREGQIAYQRITERNSLRTDIPKNFPDAANVVPKEGVPYIFAALPEYGDLQPIRKLITEALEKAGKK